MRANMARVLVGVKHMDQASKKTNKEVASRVNSLSFDGVALYSVSPESGELEIEYLSPECLRIVHLKEAPKLPCGLAALGLDTETAKSYEQKLRLCLLNHKPVQDIQLFSRKNINSPILREVRVMATAAGRNDRRFLIELSRDLSDDRDIAPDLFSHSESFLALIEQSAQRIWELDLESEVFTIFSPSGYDDKLVPQTLAFPDDFLRLGLVHHRSLRDFRTFVRKILGGSRQGGTTLVMRTEKSSGFMWHNLSYRTLLNAQGLPQKAVGILRPIEATSMQPHLFEIEQLWKQLLPSLQSFIHANLSEGRVKHIWVCGNNDAATAVGRSYRLLLELICSRFFSENSKQLARSQLNSQRLCCLAKERTPRWLCNQFEITENKAYVRSVTVHVLLEEEQSETHAFFFLQYSNETIRSLSRSRLTESCAYAQNNAKTFICTYLKNSIGTDAHALIRVCNCRDDFDPSQFNNVVAAFSLFFESFAVVSVPTERTVSVFMPNIGSAEVAREKLKASFAFVRQTLTDTKHAFVRFVAALTAGTLNADYHDEFLRLGLLVCSRLENEPTDTIERVAPSQEVQAVQIQNTLLIPAPSLQAFSDIDTGPLTEYEKTLLILCLEKAIRTDDAQIALVNLLNVLGTYYKADRVYTIRAIAGVDLFEESCEWTKPGKSCFKKLIHGMQIRKFPLLERVLKTSRPVFMRPLKRSLELQLPSGNSDSTWAYAAIPFVQEPDKEHNHSRPQTLLLCIDNPHEEIARLSLPLALAPYLGLLHQKLFKERSELISSDDFKPQAIKNFSEYQDKLSELTPEHYFSMGALVAAVPRLLSLDKEFGTKHCHDMLLFLQDLIERSFGNSVIFKKYSEEFVVLVPNTTKEVFFERSEWVQKACDLRFPDQIKIGATWSKDLFDVTALLEEARTFMLMQGDAENRTTGLIGKDWAPLLPRLQNLTIYLQPKINILDKTLVGAEALVRGVDNKGRILEPGNFLSEMVSRGMIRNLDLFVLSQTLWQLDQWIKEGHQPIPISVNFSRYTLFDQASSGAVLAILSNYDHIDPSSIEIEITETACAAQEATMARAMAPYREMGLHFALDDFGTGYSNLSIFSKLAFETIKLDRSIVHDIDSNPVSRSLIESIVRISHEHNMTVVAEGVESDRQADALLRNHCKYAQGYLFDKPMSAEAFAAKYLSVERLGIRP